MIFVQIAAYRDPQLFITIADLIDRSETPDNFRIVICRQFDLKTEAIQQILPADFSIKSIVDNIVTIKYKNYNSIIESIEVDCYKSKGACWARNLIQQRYNKEQYTLQLDSHHRFVQNWDRICIDMLEGLRYKSEKPLLTAYLPSFDPANDPQGRTNIPWQMNFDRFTPEGVVFFSPSSIDNYKELKEPIPARFYSAHFCFADGIFSEEVQHDPNFFFHGEEISIAARAFTHGYDLYHPHCLVAYHEYTRVNRTKIWDDHTDISKAQKKVDKDWSELNISSLRLNRILFGMEESNPPIDFGKYAFGNVRSLNDYEKYAGLHFKSRSVHNDTVNKKSPNLDYCNLTDADFLSNLAISNDIRVLIHFDELKGNDGKIPDDYTFWYVGAHDEHGNELQRIDYQPSQIRKYLKSQNQWVDQRFIFLSSKVPKTYTVWPVSKSKGWMQKITKNVD